MPAEYLDIGSIAWRSALESVPHGWGLVIDPAGPSTSGYIPASNSSRGQTITSLIQTLGSQGRANGARTIHSDEGHVRVEIGMTAWEAYDGVLVDPLNVREESTSSGGRGLTAVTAEGGGDFATVWDAGARFPGKQLVTDAGKSAKFLAEATLNTASRSHRTIQLRADAGLSDIRVGDLVNYVRASGRAESGMYLRVIGIAVDESALPTAFRMTGQVVEPSAASATSLLKGAFWPGTRGTGNAMMRRIRELRQR